MLVFVAVHPLLLQAISLVSQQPVLALDPAGVAGQRGIGTHDSMTGQDNCDWIECVCPPNGTISRWPSKFCRQVAIGHRCSRRDSAERGPDLLLKGRASCAHRNGVQAAIIACEIGTDPAAYAIWVCGLYQVDRPVTMLEQCHHARFVVRVVERA